MAQFHLATFKVRFAPEGGVALCKVQPQMSVHVACIIVPFLVCASSNTVMISVLFHRTCAVIDR